MEDKETRPLEMFGNRMLKAVGDQAKAALPRFMLPYLGPDAATDSEVHNCTATVPNMILDPNSEQSDKPPRVTSSEVDGEEKSFEASFDREEKLDFSSVRPQGLPQPLSRDESGAENDTSLVRVHTVANPGDGESRRRSISSVTNSFLPTDIPPEDCAPFPSEANSPVSEDHDIGSDDQTAAPIATADGDTDGLLVGTVSGEAENAGSVAVAGSSIEMPVPPRDENGALARIRNFFGSGQAEEAGPVQTERSHITAVPQQNPERKPLSAFAQQLAVTSLKAPERLAERFAEQLQQSCFDEAGMGQTSTTWDVSLPNGTRSFINQVAREFAARVEAFGFEQVEWWNGREWRRAQGKFHVVHDAVYEKYYMRLKVSWLDRLPVDNATPLNHNFSKQQSVGTQNMSLIEQVDYTLGMQKHMLEAALANQMGAVAAASERLNLAGLPELGVPLTRIAKA
eukprot:TRINITY_DN37364_c0_g1_i1.p1 TRINITY_DN37364_c0_g1~~TRINITY_DN37364_c0_g1_i1.p1  ORF type:complete len:455 (-),score=76.33 TRINITY_DN37364_c0_g1_i1:71-1435(-)